ISLATEDTRKPLRSPRAVSTTGTQEKAKKTPLQSSSLWGILPHTTNHGRRRRAILYPYVESNSCEFADGGLGPECTGVYSIRRKGRPAHFLNCQDGTATAGRVHHQLGARHLGQHLAHVGNDLRV